MLWIAQLNINSIVFTYRGIFYPHSQSKTPHWLQRQIFPTKDDRIQFHVGWVTVCHFYYLGLKMFSSSTNPKGLHGAYIIHLYCCSGPCPSASTRDPNHSPATKHRGILSVLYLVDHGMHFSSCAKSKHEGPVRQQKKHWYPGRAKWSCPRQSVYLYNFNYTEL